jgi:hypothetical protein
MSGDRARKPPDMKKASRFLVVSLAILSAAGLASDALARGGHRGGRMGGNLCLSGAMLDLSLANLDVMIKVDGRQKAALEELKKVPRNILTTWHVFVLETVLRTSRQSSRRLISALMPALAASVD